MGSVRRDFRASPHRTGSETWAAIARLLAVKTGSAEHQELLSVTGIVSQLIATELCKTHPIISSGAGDQIRIYCVYDEDALNEDNANEAALAFDATSKNWRVSIPTETEDISWSKTELAKLSKRITVRAKDDSIADESDSKSASSVLKPDLGAFFKQ